MWWLLLACGSPEPAFAPGVLLVTVDTWRADHLSEAISPEAWDLAQRGARFENAYTTIGLTTPAHASLFTGKTPPEHGLRANNHHGYRLAESHLTLAEVFSAKNWATGAFVSAYPAGPAGGLDQGFAVFDGPEEGERSTAETLALARQWLEDQKQPWFLWVHAYDPHGPYTPTQADSGGEKAAYAAEVRTADRLLGPLYREVLAAGGWVALSSDHGEVLDEETCQWQHERSSSDEVLRIPLVLAGPGIAPAVHSERVGITDLFPTLLAMAGIQPPEGQQGQSLLQPQHRPIWLAESGLCEPDCSPGCAPDGVLGKDRVVLGDQGRLRIRPGAGLEGNTSLAHHLEAYPAPALPEGTSQNALGQALGYTDSF
jgi:arylsulfatase A-like enzyme